LLYFFSVAETKSTPNEVLSLLKPMSRPIYIPALIFAFLSIALGSVGLGEDNVTNEPLEIASHEPEAVIAHQYESPSHCGALFQEEDDFWRHGYQTSTCHLLAPSDALHQPKRRLSFAPIPLLRFAPKQSPPSLFV
jgi:hypothetical protein